jgi:hypothetical protein
MSNQENLALRMTDLQCVFRVISGRRHSPKRLLADTGLNWPREFGSLYVLDDPESDMASAEILLNALAGRYTVSAAVVFAA